MPRIYVSDPLHFYTYELPLTPGAEVYVGASPQCQLALPGVPGLADVHACITCQGAEYMISDLGSPGGTFANGSPVLSVFLMPGVEYRLGAAVIMLAVDGAPPPPQMVPPMPQMAPQPWGAAPMPAYGAPYMPPQYAPPQPQPQQQPQSQPQPQQAAPASPRPKVRRLNAEELDELKSRFYNPKAAGFPFGKVIFFALVLLAIAFFANMLPVHREDALNFFRTLSRDMEKTAK